MIEDLIKKGHLSEYTKDEKMNREESPKKWKAPKKTIEVVVGEKGKDTCSEEGAEYKGMCQYIAFMTWGTSQVKCSFQRHNKKEDCQVNGCIGKKTREYLNH